MNDAELVVGILKGEIDFAELMERHARWVYCCLYRLVRNAAEAEELTERVFERVNDNLAQFNPAKACFRTWLRRILYNMAVSALRQRRHAPLSLDAMYEGGGPTVAGPEELHEAMERKARLLQLVCGLEPDERDALISYVVLGHSWEDVAGILNCHERRARYLVFKSTRKLRGEL